MPANAVQTKKWFRPKGWFTTREVAIVVNRVLRDDPSKGDMHNRQPVTPRRLWIALKDYDMYPVITSKHVRWKLGWHLWSCTSSAWLPTFRSMPLISPTDPCLWLNRSPPSTYISLTLKSLGFSTVSSPSIDKPDTWTHKEVVQHSPAANSPKCFPYHCTNPPHPPQRLPQGADSSVYDSEYMDPSLCDCTSSLAWCNQKCLGNLCSGMCAAQLSILPCNLSVSSWQNPAKKS